MREVGDFADLPVDGLFMLVYVPFTTFFALPSRADQIRCLRNVAGHLQPGGHFAMDAFVPDVSRFRNQQNVSVPDIGIDRVLIDVARHDPVGQTVASMHVFITTTGVQLRPVHLRYAWPAELDAMALVAGLELVARYGDYDRRAFDAGCGHHVSVYRALDP